MVRGLCTPGAPNPLYSFLQWRSRVKGSEGFLLEGVKGVAGQEAPPVARNAFCLSSVQPSSNEGPVPFRNTKMFIFSMLGVELPRFLLGWGGPILQ